MEKLTYTPPEFAAVFGKERTWAYRQLYKGKVQAITELGRTLIPKSEVDRLLKEAGRYLGARSKVGKRKAEEKRKESAGGKSWAAALTKRRAGKAAVKKGGKTSPDKPAQASGAASVRRMVLQRLARPAAGREKKI